MVLALQRHLSVLTKSTHVESRFCGRSRQGKAAFCTPVNPCVRSVCSRSVVVGIKSAITYAGFHALLTVTYQTVSLGHQRSDMSYSNRGQTTVYRPSLAICLWSHRQGCACAFRTQPLVHTFAAAWSGRCR